MHFASHLAAQRDAGIAGGSNLGSAFCGGAGSRIDRRRRVY
jgi:hypothetical protein